MMMLQRLPGIKISIVFCSICMLAVANACAGLEEFDTRNPSINLKEILSGGPPKDGIPALSAPRFVTAANVTYLEADDLVVGIVLAGQARAYPLRILNWHEIVNDTINNTHFAVTFCPLTKSAIVFNREIEAALVEFGVSGLLYNSNLVMYDRPSGSVWPQLALEGASGTYSKKELTVLPSKVTTWENWQSHYPHTRVLSSRTGFIRDYTRDPYRAYHLSPSVMFPLTAVDERLAPKELVIGIRIGTVSKAYPLRVVHARAGPIPDTVAGVAIRVFAGPGNTAYITDNDGDLLPAFIAYWFAWSTFNEGTLLFGEKGSK